jgi:hypothetical protein
MTDGIGSTGASWGPGWRKVLAGLLLALMALLAGWTLTGVEQPGLMEDRRFGDYQVRVYRDEQGVAWRDRIHQRLPAVIRRRWPARPDMPIAAVEVRLRNREVYRARGALLHLPDSDWGWWERRQAGVMPGADLTGDGIPNLAVYEWSGDMRDPVVLHLFEAGEQWRRIGTVAGYDPRFEDLTGDGAQEIVLIDGLFRFDPVFGAPSARVVLRWSGRGYRVAGDLMRRPVPTTEEWAELVGRFQESDAWREPYRNGGVPQSLFREALMLMYGGREEWGWRLLREGWKPGLTVDERLLEDFREQRDRSSYWQELAVQ